jgi:hypothetical protein
MGRTEDGKGEKVRRAENQKVRDQRTERQGSGKTEDGI